MKNSELVAQFKYALGQPCGNGRVQFGPRPLSCAIPNVSPVFAVTLLFLLPNKSFNPWNDFNYLVSCNY